MAIEYRVNAPLSVDAFRDVLVRSTLGERRPIDDRECLAGMLAHANLTLTAWDGDQLVGIARNLTDFVLTAYVCDLAVCASRQHKGIGRELLAQTRAQLGPRAKLSWLAAPAAAHYYSHIGFTQSERCWVLEAGQPLLGR